MEYASYDNLIRLKIELDEGRLKGHYNLVRNSCIGEAVRMTINDASYEFILLKPRKRFKKGNLFLNIKIMNGSNGLMRSSLIPFLRFYVWNK